MSDVLRSPNAEGPTAVERSQPLPFYRSPIGRKLITGLTGLGLSLFVLLHMAGNLVLLTGAEAYNQYSRHLEDWGLLLYAVEAGLLLAVLSHAALGVQIALNRRQARPEAYREYASAGSPSLQSFSSRTMIVTGSGLAVFLVWHLASFKFGPYYQTYLGDVASRDIARLVLEKFRQPLYAFGYPAVLLLLGFHLRHGLWSALQSLGALNYSLRPVAYGLSTVLAVAIAAGFMVLPLTIYFGLIG
jgi:succinate dehydrogenase / fumarate reductase, cytochrome b subunit